MQSMNRVRGLKFACLLLLGTLWHAAAVRADEKIPSERRLPKETFLHVTISNLPEFSKQFNKTSVGQLVRDKALAEFWKDVESKFSEKQKEVEKAIGTELTELPALAQGELSVALCKAGPHGVAVVGFFHYGDKQDLVNKLIEKGEKALAEEGVKRTEEDLADAKAVVLKPEGEDDPDNPFKLLAYFQKDGTLVFGTDLEALKLVLSRWDGQHERTLAKNEIYRYVVDHSRDDQQTESPALVWYVDPVGIFTSVATSSSANLGMAAAMGMLPKLGVNKIRGWGGRVEFPGGDFDMVSRSILYLEQPAGGITNLLQFDVDAQAPPKWVRSDMASYMGVNWDLQKALAGVENIADTFRGPGSTAKLIDELAQQGPKVHIRKDFLDHFSGHLHVLTKAGEGKGLKAAETRLVIALETKNAEAAKATISKLMAMAPPTFKSREFKGETIYEIPMMGLSRMHGGDEEGDAAATPGGMVIADGNLMFSNDVTMLEQILRSDSDQERLADSAAYKRVAKQFPSKTSSISFARQDAQVRAAYDMFRSGILTKGAEGVPDLTKLPEFSVLQKYFAPSGGYTILDEHGLKSITFSLSASEKEKE